jgi:3-oxoacyl-[acyl-carrier protein] reductase
LSSSQPTIPNGRPLDGKSAIVTGAATGIGKAIASRLARDGAAIVVNHLPAQQREGDAVVASIGDAGGRAVAEPADISNRQQFADLFDHARDVFGKVDILINNAAIAPLTPVAEATDEQIDAVLSVNIKGTLYGCQLAVEQLSDNGRIINISSSTTGLALPGYGIYDMSKGAIEQLTRILAKEVGPRGITVNAISPGATETDTYRLGKDPDFVAGLERMSAFNRLGRVEDIADVVAFIASDDARWITGQNIRVNGGTVPSSCTAQ